MVPVRKKQKEDMITENVKRSGGETLVSRNEILKLMAKKKKKLKKIFQQICCTVAEQSPLTTYMLQTQGVWFQWQTLYALLQQHLQGKKKSKLMEVLWSGIQLRTTGWHSSVSQCEETAAFLL